MISMIKWVEGPFVSTICNQSIGEVRLFDLLHDSKEYVSIPNSIVNDPILVKTFVDDRHELSVTFTVPWNAIEPVELRWVHFRGNLRIEPLGTGGNPLVMQPGESVKQYTRAGHLFVAMRLESTEEEVYYTGDLFAHKQHSGFADLARQIRRIVGIYMLPSMHQTCDNDVDCSLEIIINPENSTFYQTDKLVAGTVCESMSYFASSSLTACFRSLLMKYWEYQRLSQVYVNTWAVPSLPVIHSLGPTEMQFPESGEMRAVESQADLDVGGDGHYVGEKDLWMVFDLDSSLARSASTFHHTHRRSDGISSPEPPISLVFNQFEVPTWYVPLPSHLLDSIIEEVRRAAAVWLNMPTEDLLLTGAYGSREYGHGAVVRWHVDPVQSQPITAIVHVAEECDTTDSNTLHEQDASPCTDLWALEVPKSLTTEHNYSDYSTECIQSLAWHHVHLRVGQVMLLQSAKLPHARMKPYPGKWYANAFVHFAPVGWDSREDVRLLS